MTGYDPERGSAQAPIFVLQDALQAAKQGVETPGFTSESFLESIGLGGDTPDGLTLNGRFVGDPGDPANMPKARAAWECVRGAEQLIGLTNRFEANEVQEKVAGIVGAVAARQLTREGDICAIASDIILNSTRDDIVSPDIRARLGATDPMLDALVAFLDGALHEDDFGRPSPHSAHILGGPMMRGTIIIIGGAGFGAAQREYRDVPPAEPAQERTMQGDAHDNESGEEE